MSVPNGEGSARALRTLALALAAAAAGGCVSGRQIARRMIDYNIAVENARNEMLLLNVLRARERRPMVFTGLARITGSLRAESRVGAGATVGEKAPNNAQLQPSFAFVDSPTFDVAVLDSQEFTRGIMTPLGFDLIEYFWDQGFVREILIYLTVERIELECPAQKGAGAELRALENDPPAPSFPGFRGVVEALADTGRWEIDPFQTEQIGPTIDAGEARKLPSLIQVAGGRLRLESLPDGTFQLRRPTERLRVSFADFDPCKGKAGAPAPGQRWMLYETRRALEAARQGAQPELRGRMVARSPQSIIYFLGEMARPRREIAIRARQAPQPLFERRLFVVRDGSRCKKSVVETAYSGRRWVIPDGTDDCHPGRSMQSLALAAQLLSLQQSARDLPATGTVRIIGQ